MKLKIFAIFGIFLVIGIYFLLNNFNNMTTNNTINKSNIDEKNLKVAYFAGGCFWCMEGIFESQEGVKEAITGYAGGTEETAKYDIVSTGNTKHREAVKVEYDPKIISYEKLVKLFWTQIDPTDEFGQFADKGNHYTTAIFYTNDEEKSIAENSKDNLEKSLKFNKKIATKIEKFTTFFKVEENHQDYSKKSSFKYNIYKKGSGREKFIENNWEKEINNLSSDNISKENLKTKLTPLQYKVTQENGTEKAFQNEYWNNHQDGIYVDIVDGTPLFSSLDKYDSGTGWPSFTKPINLENIKELEDDNWFSRRTEVKSKKSNSHLGHVFTDGPKDKGGLRFCMNSASLRFISLKDLNKEGYGEYKKLFKETQKN